MEIIMAIITSFVASVVFYFCFQFIPEKKKYNKIRPRIEIELLELTNTLFFFLEMPFRINIHSASLFQNEITVGRLEKDDFEMGLSNKCLNETYLFDENADKFMPIGNELNKHADKASSKIRQILMNQNYLSAEEILIIEDIDRLLHIYLYNGNAFDRLGRFVVHPINPTIHYMSENFYKLYQLWKELRSLLYECKHIRKEKRQGNQCYFSLQTEKIKCLIERGDHIQAKKQIGKISKLDLTDYQKTVLDFLCLRINVETNNIESAKELLSKLLMKPEREKAVYQREFLACVRTNDELMKTCNSLCSTDEMNKWNKTVDQEKKVKEEFIKQNKQLKDYYEEKARKQPQIKNL